MLQKRYEGFLATPYLLKKESVPNLIPITIPSNSKSISIAIDETLRLGKYVERLVSFELKQHQNISIIAENVQIQNEKTTLGELDCLLLMENKPLHLEIIYKFYLYDASVGNTEIQHFIGPNKKDSLIEKLNKLKEKQLPLLHSLVCKKHLDTLNINQNEISQFIYFKAQLFLPFSNQNVKLKTLNNQCVTGFYINQEELKQLSRCKFYIPKKKDWLMLPHTHVNWISYNNFKPKAEAYFKEKFSPLLWVKSKTGAIKKVFLVWW